MQLRPVGDGDVTLATGDRVLIQYTGLEYGIYKFIGADAFVNISTTNLNDADLWEKEALAGATTTSGSLTFETAAQSSRIVSLLHSFAAFTWGCEYGIDGGHHGDGEGDLAVEGSDNYGLPARLQPAATYTSARSMTS